MKMLITVDGSEYALRALGQAMKMGAAMKQKRGAA